MPVWSSGKGPRLVNGLGSSLCEGGAFPGSIPGTGLIFYD